FWIKASGTWLADARKRDIFVQLGLKEVLNAYQKGSNDFTDCIISNNGLRPSIETSLHAVLPQKVVVHVHSINSLSWVVRKGGDKLVAERLKGLAWAWIDYIRPGLPLTRLIQTTIKGKPETNVLLMANHGLVVAADTVDDVKTLLKEVEKRLLPPPLNSTLIDDEKLKVLKKIIPEGCRLPVNTRVHLLGQNANILNLIKEGALYPDHVVFLGHTMTALEESEMQLVDEAVSNAPHCVLVKDLGVVLGSKCSLSEEAMLECFALLAPSLPAREELSYFSTQQLGELLNWDAEKMRQAADKQRQSEMGTSK
ncbi:MAG: class II aldolase/adducin family protein, partial [Bacteroidota bacterium]|nr:class II aldolase/adducin family protein [Bacteroidota bacterium]